MGVVAINEFNSIHQKRAYILIGGDIMNLKEAFRYQSFLTSIMFQATESIKQREHSLKVTRTHLRNAVNPDAQNTVTEDSVTDKIFPNDDVIRLMEALIDEKIGLTQAINKAKSSAEMDIDAAIEGNKFRQQASKAIATMLAYRAKTTKEQGRDYKFNVEGNQTPYVYDIEVNYVEAFDRTADREILRKMTSYSDTVSSNIDVLMVKTTVDFQPKYNVNDSFVDIMETV